MKQAKIIQSLCPDLAINSIELLGEGDFCRAFLVNRNLVFRFAKHEAAWQSLKRENCLLPKIAKKISLKIPQPLHSNFAENPQDSFVSYEFLPGEALTKEKYLNLDEKKRSKCAAATAKFLNEFHSIDPKISTKCGIPQIDHAAKYALLLSRLQNDLRARFEKKDFDFAVKQIENYLASNDSKSFRKVLLHGDLSPDHVLFDGANVTAIIDFGDMIIGDAAWDFLWIYEDYGTDFFVRALSNYDAKNKKKLISRVLQFSNLEAVSWLADCLENGEEELDEALNNLREHQKSQDKINSIFDNLREN